VQIECALLPGKTDLFDLSKDPGEQNNVTEQHPDIVRDNDGISYSCIISCYTYPVLINREGIHLSRDTLQADRVYLGAPASSPALSKGRRGRQRSQGRIVTP
jgi:hypothetical protein